MAVLRVRHVCHCTLMFLVIFTFEATCGALRLSDFEYSEVDPWLEYGTMGAIILYILRLLTFLALPQVRPPSPAGQSHGASPVTR